MKPLSVVRTVWVFSLLFLKLMSCFLFSSNKRFGHKVALSDQSDLSDSSDLSDPSDSSDKNESLTQIGIKRKSMRKNLEKEGAREEKDRKM